VCLTVVERRGERFWADAVAETLSRSTLGRARPGQRVNLERALRLGARLGGHLVQGHVDATAPVVDVRRRGDDHRLRVALPPGLRRYAALKGSIALHGVSLTVAALGEDWLEVALVPETLGRTTLGDLRPGDPVNVEVDLVARYLERLAGYPDEPRTAGTAGDS
jgi:riboflavin synthase